MTDRALLTRGYECLMDTLGLVNAEKFISLVIAEPSDYTEWRRENLFEGMTVEELSEKAMEYRRKQDK